MRQGRALVVGLGSIGLRHARLLGELGLAVATVTARRDGESARLPVFPSVIAALDEWRPDYVVVANPTARHEATLQTLADSGYAGRVLVEKPLFAAPAPLPRHRFRGLFVGYNLRFHPVLRALAQELRGEAALAVHIHVGSFLPDWRPGQDYRRTASASAEDGGGVLRDLSHELDFATWLFGPARRLAALGGRVGDLEIDVPDAYGLLLEFARCPIATVQMNYLDRRHTRTVTVVTASRSLLADIGGGSLTIGQTVTAFPCARDDSYRAMHQAALSDEENGDLCTAEEGMLVMNLIAAAERAAQSQCWVEP